VYHAAYLCFAERARTEFLRSRGHDHPSLLASFGGIFAVRRLGVEFRRPAHLDDLLTIETSVNRATGARLELRQTIHRATVEIAVLDVELAFIGANGRPRRLPELLRPKQESPARAAAGPASEEA
jgi:acyl-CoA thioester hydrolase